MPSPSADSTSDDDLVRLRRDDLAALSATYQRETRAPRQWAIAIMGVAAMIAAPLLTLLRSRFRWPAALEPFFFFGGWGMLLVCLAVLWHRELRARRQYRVYCPRCRATLLNGFRDAGGRAQVDAIIATGRCPFCHATVLPE